MPLHDVNERCIEMLAQAARRDRPGGATLVEYVKDLLLRVTPATCARAARRSVLLTELQFSNTSWWCSARDHPTRRAPEPSWRGGFPRTSAVPLARATVMLAWHTLRARPEDAALLGIAPGVDQVIAGLSLGEIDRIVERHFPHLRPRWEDRPGLWRALLLAAESEDFRKMRDFDLYSLQVITGDLWTAGARVRGPF